MPGQDLTNIGGLLKQLYIGPIREQLNNATVVYNRLEKNEEDVSGEDLTARIPIFHKRNQGIGFRAESGTLPTADRRSHQKTTIAMAFLYGQIQVTGQSIKASRNKATSFARVVDNEIKGMVQGLRVELNRASWGTGSGSLGTTTNTDADVTAEELFAVSDAALFEEGMILDTFAAETGGSVVLNSVTVSKVDRRNNKIALTTTVANTATHHWFREDSRGLYSMGLKGLVDGADSAGARLVTTLQGINRSTNLFWDGNVIDNSGTPVDLSLDLTQQAYELAEIIGQGRTSMIISPYAIRRAYLELLVSQRRFVKDLKLDGGFSALEYSGGGEPVPWTVDYMAPAGQAFFLDERTLAVYRAADFDWMDLDGAVLRKVANIDAYEATAYCYMNIGSSAPNKSTVLRDIQ